MATDSSIIQRCKVYALYHDMGANALKLDGNKYTISQVYDKMR